MAAVVVPYSGRRGKSRLELPDATRRELTLAMLADVVSAASELGPVTVVTADREAASLAPEVVPDPGGGQGAAVAAALARFPCDARVAVINADLPCATAGDLAALTDALPSGGIALVEAADGTTNALALASPELFAPLYGPGSARRFGVRADALGVACRRVRLPNLGDDVDTLDDLERVEGRVGRHTRGVLTALRVGAS